MYAEGNIPVAPVIMALNDKFLEKLEVSIVSYNDDCEIRFTTDESIPDQNSSLYEKQIYLAENTTVKAIVYSNEFKSKISEKIFTRVKGYTALSINNPKTGLKYKYYLGEDWIYLPKFDKLQNIKDGIAHKISINGIKDREDQFAITFEGYIVIEADGVYDFYLQSDDGSKLYIADELVVDNDGSHSTRTRSGNIGLKKGFHKFYLEYFEDCEGEELKLYYQSRKFSKKLVPDNLFVH